MTVPLLGLLMLILPHVHHTPVLDDFVRVQADPTAHAAGMLRIPLAGSAAAGGARDAAPAVVYVGYDEDAFYAAFLYSHVTPSAIRLPASGSPGCGDANWTTAVARTALGFVVLMTVPHACENEVGPAS